MASDGQSSEDLIREAKESVRPIDSPNMPPTDPLVDDTEASGEYRTVTDRMMSEGQVDQSPAPVATPSPTPVRRPDPELYATEPRSREFAEVSPSVAPTTPADGAPSGRWLQFFGKLLLVLVALLWILLLSAYADDPVDLVAVFGGGLLVTIIPGILAILLSGAGDNRAAAAAASTVAVSGEVPRPSGRFVRFVGWVILILIALGWIVLLIGLLEDPGGIITSIFGGVLISVVPATIGFVFISEGTLDATASGENGELASQSRTTVPTATSPSVRRLDPEPYVPKPESEESTKVPRPAASQVTVSSLRNGRVQRFFGWVVLIVIALGWLRMLAGLADVQDVFVSIGVAVAITLVPAFVGIMLLGAGNDETPDSELTLESGGESGRGGLFVVLCWILLLLTLVSWVVLIVALFGDSTGVVGTIVGGLVVSLVPIFVALLLLADGDTPEDSHQLTSDV